MKKLIIFFILISCFANAQEKYNWLNIEDVKFYDLKDSNCIEIDSAEKIPKENKVVLYKKPRWEKILPNLSNAERDVANESTCYVLVIRFKNSETIPFLLFPNQKALFDMRKNHFNFILLGKNVYKKFDEVLKLSIDCSNNPNCNQVN